MCIQHDVADFEAQDFHPDTNNRFPTMHCAFHSSNLSVSLWGYKAKFDKLQQSAKFSNMIGKAYINHVKQQNHKKNGV